MSLPRVGVVGSCVSRDAFNRSFAPNYKNEVELVSSIYQSSLPSLARETKIEGEVPGTVTQNYLEDICREYSGKNLDDLVNSRPDIVVLDTYADVQFGVTEVDRQYVTRNHMAFTALNAADIYYGDEGKEFPVRGRFEGCSEGSDNYFQLAKDSISHLVSRIREKNKGAQFVVNSARFASAYLAADDQMKNYDKADRLDEKNKHWGELDQTLRSMTQGIRIVYPDELIVGREEHKWGLNPVHYDQAYYDYFWQSLKKIIRE